MIAPLAAARSILQSAHGLLNEEASHPQLAPMLSEAAARLVDQAIITLQAARAARPVPTLGGLDAPGVTPQARSSHDAAGAAPQDPHPPTLAPSTEDGSDRFDRNPEAVIPVKSADSGDEPASAIDTGDGNVVWTPARRAHLALAVPRGDEWNAILLALNAIPAPLTVASVKAVRMQAHKTGLRRPPGAIPEPQPPRPNGRPPLVWVPERDALLRDLFPQGTATPEIVTRANAIPAAKPVPHEQSVNDRARALGLVRPAEYLEALAASRADHARRGNTAWRLGQAQEAATPEEDEPETAESDPEDEPTAEPAPLPTAAPPPAPPRAPITPAEATRQEYEEIFECFDAGQTVRLIAEEFNIGLSAAANHHAAWRAARAAQKGEAARDG